MDMLTDLDSLSQRLFLTPPVLPLVPTRSDYDLNPTARPSSPADLVPAAVVIPIIDRPEPTILFTVRSPHLSRHAGQVSFPGGRHEVNDASLTATALREMEEEIGIRPDNLTVAGYLEPYETITGFAVLPVVALVSDDFTLTVDPNEVEDVFEVPVSLLLDMRSLQEERIVINGQTRRVYAFQFGLHRIWGATAAILVDLREHLTWGS